MPSYQPLIVEYRGELIDLTHSGYAVIVDEGGRVVFSMGNPDEMVFYRSASKPIQALPVIARGLDKEYGLTDEETVIFAGSHMAEPRHVEALESIHKKAGLREDCLVMNPALPQAKHQPDTAPRKLYHNCSGKHTGAMLLQRALGGPVCDYWKPDSPAQNEIRRTVALLSEFPLEKVVDGIDGCGVPVFSVGMKNIAIAFRNLAHPAGIAEPDLAEAAARYAPRIHAFPHMMRGSGMLCTRLNMDPEIVAKGGAKAVYGFGLKGKKLGFSLKLADGVEAVWPMVIARLLREAGHENPETYAMLEELCPETILNDNGTACGRRIAVF